MAATPGRSATALPARFSAGLLPVFARAAGVAVGPLAAVAFFLPWGRGPGVLAGEQFSGFEVVGFAGRLRALDLAPGEEAALWLVRLAVLGVAVAAAWQMLLAPAHRWHPAYRVSGWYLVAAAVAGLGVGVAREGLAAPPAGVGLLALAGALWVAAWGCERRGLMA